MIPPTVYYGKVGLELAKLVARGQKMSPPYVMPMCNARDHVSLQVLQ
jgi:hypothetical protein